MEVYPAGLSAHGMMQAHDQSPTGVGGEEVCAYYSEGSPYLLTFCTLNSFLFHFLSWTRIIICIYQQLQLQSFPLGTKTMKNGAS